MTAKIRLAGESPEALDFYQKLGFVSSDYGLKLKLQSSSPQ
jgi:hypothetical protein